MLASLVREYSQYIGSAWVYEVMWGGLWKYSIEPFMCWGFCWSDSDILFPTLDGRDKSRGQCQKSRYCRACKSTNYRYERRASVCCICRDRWPVLEPRRWREDALQVWCEPEWAKLECVRKIMEILRLIRSRASSGFNRRVLDNHAMRGSIKPLCRFRAATWLGNSHSELIWSGNSYLRTRTCTSC